MSNKDKFLSEFEQMVMLALIYLESEAYGAAIRQLLALQINRNVVIGALYSTLKHFENNKLKQSDSIRGQS